MSNKQNRNNSLEPDEDEDNNKSQSHFTIRQASSFVVDGGSIDPEEAKGRNNLNINGYASSQESMELHEPVSPTKKNGKIEYQNMDGEKILRYIKAKLKTNPFQRWQIRNNKFPIKFLLHIVLILFVTMQVMLMAKQEIDYTRFNIDFWKSTLLNIDDGSDNKNTKLFFTPTDLQGNLEEMVSFFQNIQTQTQFDVVNYNETNFYLLSYYTIWPTDKSHRLTYINEINIDEGIVEPFLLGDTTSLKYYTQKVNMFTILVQNLQTRFSLNSNICWDIRIQYIIEDGILVEASVDADQVVCNKSKITSDDPTDDPDEPDTDKDALRILKDRFKRLLVTTSGEKFINNSELKLEIKKMSQQARKNKRRIIAEALSENYIQEEWSKFQMRKGFYQLQKPTKRGYQRVPSPYKKNVNQTYHPTRILVPSKGRILKSTQSTSRFNHGFNTIYVNIMVIILASILFFLHMRYVYRIFVLYECAKQATDRAYLQNIRLKQSTKNNKMIQSQQSGSLDLDKGLQTRKLRNIYDDKHSLKWENITLSEKLKFFNKWQLLSMLGNFFQICGSILLFVSQYALQYNARNDISFVFDLKERLIGFGSAIAWITIVQYVEYDRKHIIFSNLLGKVIKQWLYTLIGILPVFMAFAIVGYAFYYESVFFHSMSYTMTTLFATYHGDQISDFMNSIQTFESPFHLFYMLTFTMLFAMAVYNFFTSTIGLAWDEIKEKRQNKLLKQQLKENYLIEEELFKARDDNTMRISSDQKLSSDQLLDYRTSTQMTPTKMMRQTSTAQDNEEQIVLTSLQTFEKFNEFLSNTSNSKKKIVEKIDEYKKYAWSDAIAKKNQIEQLFKEMVEFEHIIEVLDIGDQDKDIIKAKYKKYFNFTINTIHRLIEDISSL